MIACAINDKQDRSLFIIDPQRFAAVNKIARSRTVLTLRSNNDVIYCSLHGLTLNKSKPMHRAVSNGIIF